MTTVTKCLCGEGRAATGFRACLPGCPTRPDHLTTKAALECAGRGISMRVRQLAGAWPDEAGREAQAWVSIVELLGFRQGPPDADGFPMPVSRFVPVKRWREVSGRFLCVDEDGKLAMDRGTTYEVADATTMSEIIDDLVLQRDEARAEVASAGERLLEFAAKAKDINADLRRALDNLAECGSGTSKDDLVNAAGLVIATWRLINPERWPEFARRVAALNAPPTPPPHVFESDPRTSQGDGFNPIAEVLQQIDDVVRAPPPPGPIRVVPVTTREMVVKDLPAVGAEEWEVGPLRAALAAATHLIAYDDHGILHREPIQEREADGVPVARTFKFQAIRRTQGVQFAFVNKHGFPIWWTHWTPSDNMDAMPGTTVAFTYNGVRAAT